MVTYINETGITGIVIEGIIANVTGSMFLTLLIALALIIVFALMFRIPLEFTALLIFPLIIGFFVYGGAAFGSVLGIILIYLAVLLAKNFFFWK